MARTLLTASVVSCVTATATFAGPIIPGVTSLSLDGTDGTNTWIMNPSSVPYDDTGAFSYSAGTQDAGSFSISNLQVTGNVDPVISVSFDLTNNSPTDQTYIINVALPVAPSILPTINGGSTGITITDGNGNGVTASDDNPASVFYTALINGSPIATIDLLDTDLSAGNFLSNTTTGSFGEPIPSLGGPPLLNSIAIRYEFTLTPGDRAGVTGVFVSEVVPEPTSLAMIAAGGLLVARRRKRSL